MVDLKLQGGADLMQTLTTLSCTCNDSVTMAGMQDSPNACVHICLWPRVDMLAHPIFYFLTADCSDF